MARTKKTQHGSRRSTPIDIYIGKKLRAARNLADLSQEQAADTCGISFQQIQKYEKGVNRINPKMLVTLCSLYNITVESLFDGAPGYAGTTENKNDIPSKFFSIPVNVRIARDCLSLEPSELAIVHNLSASLAARHTSAE